jgi:hypothetical protein
MTGVSKQLKDLPGGIDFMRCRSMYAIVIGLIIFASVSGTLAQRRETFTGTVLSYGSGLNTRMRTGTFTLDLKNYTADQDAGRFLDQLRNDGQDSLLSSIRNEDLGRFSVGANLGQRINAARETMIDGRRRIYIVFERWMQFAELRGGYRSRDYPFGYVELDIDPRTGRGEGTYIAAARIRWRKSSGSQGDHVEVEDFGTYPARLMNVRTTRGAR